MTVEYPTDKRRLPHDSDFRELMRKQAVRRAVKKPRDDEFRRLRDNKFIEKKFRYDSTPAPKPVVDPKDAAKLGRALKRVSLLIPYPPVMFLTRLSTVTDLVHMTEYLWKEYNREEIVYTRPGDNPGDISPHDIEWGDDWTYEANTSPPPAMPTETSIHRFKPLTGSVFNVGFSSWNLWQSINSPQIGSDWLPDAPQGLGVFGDPPNLVTETFADALAMPGADIFTDSEGTGWARISKADDTTNQIVWDNRHFWYWTGEGAPVAPVVRTSPRHYTLPPVPTFYPRANPGNSVTEPSNHQPWYALDTVSPSVDVPAIRLPVIGWPSPAPGEQTEVSPQPATQELTVSNSGVRSVSRPGRPRNRRPDRRVKERKIRMGPTQRAIWVIAGEITEGVDFVEAMHDALPRDLRAPHGAPPQEMAAALYDHWDDPRFSVAQAFANYVNMQFEDWVYGTLSVDKQANQLLNSPTGKGRFASDLQGNAYEASEEGMPIPQIGYDQATGDWWIDYFDNRLDIYKRGQWWPRP